MSARPPMLEVGWSALRHEISRSKFNLNVEARNVCHVKPFEKNKTPAETVLLHFGWNENHNKSK